MTVDRRALSMVAGVASIEVKRYKHIVLLIKDSAREINAAIWTMIIDRHIFIGY